MASGRPSWGWGTGKVLMGLRGEFRFISESTVGSGGRGQVWR
jgi:hypothetical protein